MCHIHCNNHTIGNGTNDLCHFPILAKAMDARSEPLVGNVSEHLWGWKWEACLMLLCSILGWMTTSLLTPCSLSLTCKWKGSLYPSISKIFHMEERAYFLWRIKVKLQWCEMCLTQVRGSVGVSSETDLYVFESIGYFETFLSQISETELTKATQKPKACNSGHTMGLSVTVIISYYQQIRQRHSLQ